MFRDVRFKLCIDPLVSLVLYRLSKRISFWTTNEHSRLLTRTFSIVQESNSRDRTRETCVPNDRWIPEHRMHIKLPIVKDAHFGPTGESAKNHCDKIFVGSELRR